MTLNTSVTQKDQTLYHYMLHVLLGSVSEFSCPPRDQLPSLMMSIISYRDTQGHLTTHAKRLAVIVPIAGVHGQKAKVLRH